MGDVPSIEEHTETLRELSQGRNLVLHRITRGYQEAVLVKNTPNLRTRARRGEYDEQFQTTRRSLQRLDYLETLSDITFTNVLAGQQQSLALIADIHDYQEDAEILLGVSSTGQPFHLVIHDTRQGPPVGGLRSHDYTVRWNDQSTSAMLLNALRIAQTTTLQAALLETRTGGGSIVRQRTRKETEEEKEQTLYDIATALNITNSWRTEERKQPLTTREYDGTSHEDIIHLANWTPYIARAPRRIAHYEAETLHSCIITGAKQQGLYTEEQQHLKGLTILLQGLNDTADELLKKLLPEGAHIIATDNNEDARRDAHFIYRFRNVTIAELPKKNTDRNLFWKGYARDAHIALACSGSLTWNEETLHAFTGTPIKLVTGSAWHQYSNEEPTRQSRDWNDAGILALPDIITTGAGLIATTPSLPKRQRVDDEELLKRSKNISRTLETILEQAKKNKTTPWEETIRVAEEKLRGTKTERKGKKNGEETL